MGLSTIFKRVDEAPFNPFTIELENGRRMTLAHPENIHFIPNRTKVWEIDVYDEEKDIVVAFHPSTVTSVVTDRGNGGA